jgi:hypothetical protein
MTIAKKTKDELGQWLDRVEVHARAIWHFEADKDKESYDNASKILDEIEALKETIRDSKEFA